jgi:DNA ligase-1
MKAFTDLYTAIDETTKTNAKIDALVEYFRSVSEEDSLWCVALFTSRRPKRAVKTTDLKLWTMELAGVPGWLFEECYQTVGDLAETISLLIPSGDKPSSISLSELMQELLALSAKTDEEKKNFILSYWLTLSKEELFIFNKFITGGFRVGVSQQLVFKALAKAFDVNENVVAHRLIGNWLPQHTSLKDLMSEQATIADDSKPYPFYLSYQLDVEPAELGSIAEWQVERKFDGIRGQIILRNGEIYVWSRGEELVTDKFPEFIRLKEQLADGIVLDGEILPVKNGVILSFAEMQKRIGRKNLSKKILNDLPLAMMCYDLLEYEGRDLRNETLVTRRQLLEDIVNDYTRKETGAHKLLHLSETLPASDWTELDQLRQESKEKSCEGLMLKKLDSVYETGRKRGKWWKWKVDPYTIDAVMIYAQRGHGRRANLYTDFTFAVWDGDTLVPFTKAYSGLTDKELVEVDRWIKKNTIDKFGPVRSVNAELVFEIAFEGIALSARHKSGVALRFPRIARWRKDKPKEEANTRQDLLNLLQNAAGK